MSCSKTEVTVFPYRFVQVPVGEYSRKLEVYNLDAGDSGEEPKMVLDGNDLNKLQMWFESLQRGNVLMKLSDVLKIAELYYDSMNTPNSDGTRFGCDCGCGGDSYTPEMWDAEMKAAEEAWEELVKLCTTFGVTYES